MEEERPLRRDEPKKPPRMCKTATLLSKIVFVLCLIALFLHMIGFYCPYWSTREFFPPRGRLTVETRGLWQKCQFTYLHSRCDGVDSYGCRWSQTWHTTLKQCCIFVDAFILTWLRKLSTSIRCFNVVCRQGQECCGVLYHHLITYPWRLELFLKFDNWK